MTDQIKRKLKYLNIPIPTENLTSLGILSIQLEVSLSQTIELDNFHSLSSLSVCLYVSLSVCMSVCLSVPRLAWRTGKKVGCPLSTC